MMLSSAVSLVIVTPKSWREGRKKSWDRSKYEEVLDRGKHMI